MSSIFVSFGGPTESYRNRVNEIAKQAKDTDMFDHIVTFTDKDLENDQEFWGKHGQFMSDPNNQRGYGFWLWKPYIILKVLETLKDGDFLVYADAGCTINPGGIGRYREYKSMLESSPFGLLAFQLYACNDNEYIKRATLEYIGATDQDKNTPQIITTALMIKKTEQSVKFVRDWYQIASIYEFIDDSHHQEEFAEFRDHRHDQAIFSLLVKRASRMECKIGRAHV